ncbi:MAG: DUF1003 domain-containing protein [archaeon]
MEKKRLILNHPAAKVPKTFGQKAADNLTKWAGSWIFILLFVALLIIWVATNGYFYIKYAQGTPFDPYPFILLNLILSCIAAMQAPIILMSQNREAERDRARAEYDYAVNRKAEKEIQEIKKNIDKIEKFLLRKR